MPPSYLASSLIELPVPQEVYADFDALNAHAGGPYFGAFFAEAGTYAEGPTWLMRGNLIGDKANAAG